MSYHRKYSIIGILTLCSFFLLLSSCTSSGNSEGQNLNLAELVDIDAIVNHLQNLEQIANENSGHRAAGSMGYNQSVEYIKDQLAGTGFIVMEQSFTCRYFEETAVPVMQVTAPAPRTFEWWDEFRTATFSGSGDVTAEIVFINPLIPPGTVPDTSADGCESGDFTNIDVNGKIAVIQRGTCWHQTKVENAVLAGASAVIIFNEGTDGRTNVYSTRMTRTKKVNIPVLTTSYAVGLELLDLFNSGQAVTMRVQVTTIDEWVSTSNVLAETPGWNGNQIIVAGAHLDSVRYGPGINDNGTGSAALLHLAKLMAEQGYQPENKIIFAWWAAEEQGLLGSFHYLEDLYTNTPAEFQNIGVCLNFDMLGSPNYVRGITDSDGSDIPAGIDYVPPGSTELEAAFVDYFHAQGQEVVYTRLGGGSDHYSFALYGIPASTIFSGAGGIKTPEEQAMFGGTAGQAHDPCYHSACDTASHINHEILLQHSRAMAHVTQLFGDKEGSLFEGTAARVQTEAVEAKIRARTEKPDLNHKDRLFRDER